MQRGVENSLCSDRQNLPEICKHISMQKCSLMEAQPQINGPTLNLLSNLMFSYTRLLLDRRWRD